MDEREAEIQTLQDTITELHHELSLKDQENLRQMQELHRFESKVKEVSTDVQCGPLYVPHSHACVCQYSQSSMQHHVIINAILAYYSRAILGFFLRSGA